MSMIMTVFYLEVWKGFRSTCCDRQVDLPLCGSAVTHSVCLQLFQLLANIRHFPARPPHPIVCVDVTASCAHSSLPLSYNKSKRFNKRFHFIAQKRFGPFARISISCVSAFSKISLKHEKV